MSERFLKVVAFTIKMSFSQVKEFVSCAVDYPKFTDPTLELRIRGNDKRAFATARSDLLPDRLPCLFHNDGYEKRFLEVFIAQEGGNHSVHQRFYIGGNLRLTQAFEAYLNEDELKISEQSGAYVPVGKQLSLARKLAAALVGSFSYRETYVRAQRLVYEPFPHLVHDYDCYSTSGDIYTGSVIHLAAEVGKLEECSLQRNIRIFYEVLQELMAGSG